MKLKRGVRMKIKQIISGILLSAILMSSAMPLSAEASQADSTTTVKPVQEKLTIDSAIAKATAYSMQIRQITTAKENAMKGYSSAESAGARAAGMLHDYNVYKNLDANGAKDALSNATLEMYRAMFGPQPVLSFEQIYDQFIVPSEVMPYQVYVQYQGLKIDEPIVVSSVEYQTKQMYYGILSYQHTIKLMQDSLKISEKKIKEMELRYKVGQVAKATLDMEKLSYTKSQLELEKQKKDLKVLEMQFNGLLGLPESTAVVLTDPGLAKPATSYNYSQLVAEALENRGDLKKSQLEIDSLNKEVKVMTEYLRDPKLDRRVDADQRLLSAKLAKSELEAGIRAEVLVAYSGYKQSEESLRVASEKVSLSEKQLVKIKQLYKAGYVKALDVYGVELQLQNSKLGYETAVYDYNKQLDALARVTRHSVN